MEQGRGEGGTEVARIGAKPQCLDEKNVGMVENIINDCALSFQFCGCLSVDVLGTGCAAKQYMV